MRKRIYFSTFILLIMGGYLFVLAYPGPPGPSGWTEWASLSNNKTAPNGVYLNVYVSLNFERLANPNWNYRSYHWACASNVGNNSLNFEFKHLNNGWSPQVNQRDNQGYDENSTVGIYEYDNQYYTSIKKADFGDGQVHPYTELWSDDRVPSESVKAQLNYVIPNW